MGSKKVTVYTALYTVLQNNSDTTCVAFVYHQINIVVPKTKARLPRPRPQFTRRSQRPRLCKWWL